ncbi:hypothetical protein MXB_1541 [Myxobolus squamalis]|nr:hypothetical protein MXB_1541 [Myxobolus squamalis]
MLVYPEGTRRDPRNKKKTEISDSAWLKRERDSSVTRWVYCPRNKGFDMILTNSGNALKYIYDATVMYRGHQGENKDPTKFQAPSFAEYLSNSNIEIHIILKKYSAREFEGTEPKIDIFKLFQEKNRTMDKFYEFGSVKGVEPARASLDAPAIIRFTLFVLVIAVVVRILGPVMFATSVLLLFIASSIKFVVIYNKYLF